MNCYLVGGAVRDKLLGFPIKDRDWVVVGTTAKEMKKQGYQQVGKDFPVFLHPKSKEEYALARTEKKQGQGYTGFSCYAEPDVTLEQDLLRRDLTINAMALSAEGNIIDPYNGQDDIQNKQLRHVSDAFIEDPLRVLRVARFAARFNHLGFTIAPETLQLMKDIAQKGELTTLTPERVWQEMAKALHEKSPWVFFESLKLSNALVCILPELDRLWGIPNPEQWHPEIDSGIHTMMVLKQACQESDQLSVRFASLCHDLGKGKTPCDQWPSHHGHELLGVPVIKALAERLRVPNECRDLACLVSEFHLHTHKAFELNPKTILNVFNKLDAWRKPERFKQFLTCCKADMNGRLGFEQHAYPQVDYLLACLHAANQVDIKQIVASGLKGAEIKNALNTQRIATIKALKQNMPQ